MATWQVIAGGTTYNLNDRNPFDVVSVTGVGIAPARRLTQRGPLQHGETDLGYRLDPRVINLVLAFQAASLSAADTHRATLARIFRGSDTPVLLRYLPDAGSTRQIECFAIGLTDWPITDDDRVGAFQRVGVQLFCPDPLWYYPYPSGGTLQSLGGSWYLGGGTIDNADVITHGTNISTVTAWNGGGAVAAGDPWTIVARAKRDVSGSPGDTKYVWSVEGASPGYPYEMYGTYREKSPGGSGMWGVNLGDENTPRYYFNNPDDDDYHFLAWVSTGQFWVDGTPNAVPAGFEGLPDTNRKWGAGVFDAGPYAHTITHVAAYSTALNATQIAALRAMADGSESGVMTNDGDADTFPYIVLNGPMTNPVLTNVTTGDVLDFTITLADGEFLNIDTRYGYKTVLDNEGANQLAALSADSDLATWHLAPGDNQITIEVDDVTYDGSIAFSWFNRYVSI